MLQKLAGVFYTQEWQELLLSLFLCIKMPAGFCNIMFSQ